MERQILIVAGLLAWGVMLMGWALAGGLTESTARVVTASVCWVLFAVSFVVVSATPRHHSLTKSALQAVQAVSTLLLVWQGHIAHAGVLFVVIAGQLGVAQSGRVLSVWLGGQTIAAFLLILPSRGLLPAALTMSTYLAFQLFAATAGWLAQREAQARTEVLRVHAELMATQLLLQDTTRDAERLRISRELHDTLGHHLTALSLHLEVARNTAPDNAAIEKSQQISRAMLDEVRNVVGTMRKESPLDLHKALKVMMQGLPGLKTDLAFPDEFRVADAQVAHAIFRVVQEALTNVVRHAKASSVWVRVESTSELLKVEIRDDGLGAASFQAGNGLTGLRERIEALGGTLRLEPATPEGTALRATIPLTERRT